MQLKHGHAEELIKKEEKRKQKTLDAFPKVIAGLDLLILIKQTNITYTTKTHNAKIISN